MYARIAHHFRRQQRSKAKSETISSGGDWKKKLPSIDIELAYNAFDTLNHMVASHQQNSEITFDEVIANELKGQHIQEESTTQHCNNKRSLRNVRNAFFPFPREQSQHEMCAEAARHVEKRRVWMSMSNPM